MSRRFPQRRQFSLGLPLGLAFFACAIATLAPTPTPASAADPVVAAAGDIACDPSLSGFNGGLGTTNSCHQMRTSDLLVGANLAAVLTLGDNQYECGGSSAFLQSYDPSWGRVKAITRPAIGNHEYETSGGLGCDTAGTAAGYFDYFNGIGNVDGPAGERGKGYYSYDIGSWHLIALNSQCSKVSCSAGDPQESWLRSDLSANPNKCTLAYWHHARFSSGTVHGDHPTLSSFWQALYDNGADIVLSGHDHIYERFAPQTAAGVADAALGIREFVVGTGGKSRHVLGTPKPNSEVRNANTYGVLKLTLRPGAYDWNFTPEAGGTFGDTGSGICHSASDLSLSNSDTPDPALAGQTLTYDLRVQNGGPADTSGVTITDDLPATVSFQAATPSQGSCAEAGGTVACNLGALASGASATVAIAVIPQDSGTITNTASVQADASDPVSANNVAQESTVVTDFDSPDGYARPKSANQTVVRLVPAYERCTEGNGLHGAPLASTSCGPPSLTSDHLTVGSPDANGTAASSLGSVQLRILGESPIDPSNGDQADVQTTIGMTDVLKQSDLSDYSGELEVIATLRMTDRDNGPGLSDPATVIDVPLRFTVPCAATIGNEGGSCQLTTTADGVLAGIAREGKRAIWELVGVGVFDGGPDGVASTADNTLFAVQGLFAP